MPINKTDLLKLLLVILAGGAAGFISGLLGAGGGIVLIFALSAVLRKEGDCTRDHFATSLAAVTVFSMVSAAMYQGSGLLIPGRSAVFLLPAAAGGVAGAFLLDRIDTRWLKRLFGALVLYAGLNMLR